MVTERAKVWVGVVAGIAAGVVVTALWMEGRGWRSEMERRVEALEAGAVVAGASLGQGARLVDATVERVLAAGSASAAAGAAQGCEAPGKGASLDQAGREAGAGVSAAEWLAGAGRGS